MAKEIDRTKCEEIWIKKEDGRAMCALINGDLGWLMVLRHSGDAGLSSRNPDYRGSPEAMQSYLFNNGQLDQYPLSWALPVAEVRRALKDFESEGNHRHGSRGTTIHNDRDRRQKSTMFYAWTNFGGQFARGSSRRLDSLSPQRPFVWQA